MRTVGRFGLLSLTLSLALMGCATHSNYLEVQGPRYGADYVNATSITQLDAREMPERQAEPLLAMAAAFPGESPATVSAPIAIHGAIPTPVHAAMTPSTAWSVLDESTVTKAPVIPKEPHLVKVVSYNVKFGEKIERAVEELTTNPDLRDADIIMLQEMGPDGTDRIARALGYRYIYYPASIRNNGDDFGNAVLTRWKIVGDQKVLLPHAHPVNGQRRIAVRTDIDINGHVVQAYSVHTETAWMGVEARVNQVRAVVASLDDEIRPAVIAGDFNTMEPAALPLFEDIFEDAGFERATDGVGHTCRAGFFKFQFDHVFTRGVEIIRAGKVNDAEASDHLPVWVELALI